MLSFATTTPSDLLAAIKDNIDKGHIDTWEYDKAGDFTHKTSQWRGKAWLCPVIGDGALQFGILMKQKKALEEIAEPSPREVYAIYHGRFVEMMLSHFDRSFSSAFASALLQVPDRWY